MGWRLPACEIEQVTIRATRQILKNKTLIADTIREVGIETRHILTILDTAAKLLDKKGSLSETMGILNLVERVDLSSKSIDLTVKLNSLIPPDINISAPIQIHRNIPMTLKRRGIEMRLVLEGDATSPSSVSDPVLIKAIARAHGWFQELSLGKVKSMTAIATREKVSGRYIARLLPLAFLAPDIVDAILSGKQPCNLTTDRLTKHAHLPIDWLEQRQFIRIA